MSIVCTVESLVNNPYKLLFLSFFIGHPIRQFPMAPVYCSGLAMETVSRMERDSLTDSG